MTSEQERWAFASELIDIHGSDIGRFMTKRFYAMLEAGDENGRRFWEDIAERVLALTGPAIGAKRQ
jgi:hypothetical protein